MNLGISVLDFLKCCVADESKETSPGASQGTIIFLLDHGFDYYDILAVVIESKFTFSEEELSFFTSHIPEADRLKNLELSTIHRMIPRWTATKYHTGPIGEVLEDIRHKCLMRQNGLYVYNSNLNLRNKKAANDAYVLMVTKDGVWFCDINRKRSYQYHYK